MKKFINREISCTLEKYSKMFSVLLLTGSRQVGKTTLLKIRNENINFVTLDDLKERSLAIEDPELFLKIHGYPLIIDEFQYAPNLLSYIKIIVDEKKLENLKNNKENEVLYYLTGSEVFNAMEGVSETLAGRIGIINMYGLSNKEIYNVNNEIFVPCVSKIQNRNYIENLTINTIFERIIKGSYPEVYQNDSISTTDYYSSYVATYIERDIRKFINVKDETKFLKYITTLASRSGSVLNISDLASACEISSATAESWLSILKNTGIIYILKPYYNIEKRVIKSPKVYFMDTGLACYLIGYTDAKILLNSAYNGNIFETLVISEIIKNYSNNGVNLNNKIYYYRDSNKNEIDLFILDNNEIYPIEIKMSSNPGKDSVKKINSIRKLNINIKDGLVICLADNIFPIDQNNFLLPIKYI